MSKELWSKWKELISGEFYHSVEEVLVRFKSPSSLAQELNITLTLPKKSPKVFTINQLHGLSSVSLVVVHLIDNCRTHAGQNANVNIVAFSDKDFQYVDIKDDGPGIMDIRTIKRDAVLFGRGGHHGSSLDLACFDASTFGAVVIPYNIENNRVIEGACLRIQIPLDQSKMNRESSKDLRKIVANSLGLS